MVSAATIASKKKKTSFDPQEFLAHLGEGRTIAKYRQNHIIFAQGDPADAVYYILDGKVKITVLSKSGKEAVLAILEPGDFFGEGCLNGHTRRMATAATMTDCSIMRVDKATMIRSLHEEPKLSEMFITYLLHRNFRVEEDLVDQLFQFQRKTPGANSSAAGEFRQGKQTRPRRCSDQPGNARRDGRHHPLARQFFHEQIPPPRLHRLQWWRP